MFGFLKLLCTDFSRITFAAELSTDLVWYIFVIDYEYTFFHVYFIFLYNEVVKLSHLYLYRAFNNTDCVKAALQYQIGK